MPPQATARSPFAGCVIMIAAMLILVFLIGFSIWVPFRQADEIEKFTKKEPVVLPVAPVEGNETAVNALVERFETFRSAATGGEEAEARIELDADDLNLAIAISPALEQLRGSFHVREIRDDKLVIDISYRLNGRPRLAREGEDGPVTSDPLYLVGSIQGRPELMRRELVLKVDSLEVPGSAVPEEFMNHFSTLRIFEASLKDETIGPVMAVLTRAELRDGKMILARIPGETPPETVSDREFRAGGGRVVKILGAGAALFLVFAGLMIFFGLRHQARREREKETNS